jgi:hypothetical protein
MGLGRPTQTSWQDGPWSTRPNLHYGDEFGSADPNLPQFTQSNQKNKKNEKKLSKLPSQTMCVHAQGLRWPVQATKKIKKKRIEKKIAKLPS